MDYLSVHSPPTLHNLKLRPSIDCFLICISLSLSPPLSFSHSLLISAHPYTLLAYSDSNINMTSLIFGSSIIILNLNYCKTAAGVFRCLQVVIGIVTLLLILVSCRTYSDLTISGFVGGKSETFFLLTVFASFFCSLLLLCACVVSEEANSVLSKSNFVSQTLVTWKILTDTPATGLHIQPGHMCGILHGVPHPLDWSGSSEWQQIQQCLWQSERKRIRRKVFGYCEYIISTRRVWLPPLLSSQIFGFTNTLFYILSTLFSYREYTFS